uniref:Uncharacterized protein n=1 Tax=Panagrolaimus sp. JU765 TaxID=591449 RepID=A0AC34Q5J4_9BILA
MMDDIVYFIGLPLIIGVISYYFIKFINSGLNSSISVSVKDEVPVFQKNTTLFYKHHIGSYSDHSSALKEIISLLPQGSSTVQILYDDERSKVPKHLQSAIGCIFGEDGEDFYTQNFAVQLKRFGYERLVIKSVGKVLFCVVPNNQSWFSFLNLKYRVRSALSTAFDELETKPESMVIIHVIDTSKNLAYSFIPLENVEEFIDAQFLQQDELEAKLARQKFDSDESSSESEPDLSENEGGDEANDEEQE